MEDLKLYDNPRKITITITEPNKAKSGFDIVTRLDDFEIMDAIKKKNDCVIEVSGRFEGDRGDHWNKLFYPKWDGI